MVIFAAGAALLTLAAAGPERGAPLLDRELARVAADVKLLVPENQAPPVNARLEQARTALAAGRPYLALYELEVPWEAASSFQFVTASGTVSSFDAFTSLWKKTGEPKAAIAGAPRVPAVVEALAAAAEARGPATYRASLPYAQDAGVSAGMYYLGNSRATGAFASFARGLPWDAEGTPPAFRSITTELDAFDREVTTAYEKMDRSEHPTYMLTSVTIKQARTLNDQHQYAAAMLEYLIARLRFGALRPAGAEATPARLDEARRALPSGQDTSIARLFIDMAAVALDAPEAAQHASAAVVLNDVLPAYAAALSRAPVTTAASRPEAVGATITLVRWPFT